MVRRLIIFCLLSIGMAGCYPEDFNNVEWGPEPKLELSEPGVTLRAEQGSSDTIEVATNYREWEATVEEEGKSWCKLEKQDTKLIIKVEQNRAEGVRTTAVSVRVGGKAKSMEKKISVTQLGTAPKIVLNPDAAFFELTGGEQRVSVTTNSDNWRAETAMGSDWCSVRRDGAEMVLTALRNPGRELREALVTVTGGTETSETTTTLKITQLGSDPVLKVSELGSFTKEAGSKNLTVMTNRGEWEVTVPSTAGWCSVDKSGTTLTVRVERNEGRIERSCELLVTAGSGEEMLKYTVKVMQLGEEFALMLSSDTLQFDSDASMEMVNVYTNMEHWEAQASEDWITILRGDNTLTVSVKENESETVVRHGTVTVTGENGVERLLRVIQLPDIRLVFSRDTLSFERKGGMQSVTVQTNQSEVRAEVAGDAKWCTAEIAGNQLNVTVLENISVPRTAVVNVTVGTGEAVKVRPVTILQEGLASDRDILMEFYEATGGDSWTRNDNWGSDKPLSEWYGVTAEPVEPLTKAGEPVERVTRLVMVGEFVNGVGYTGNNLVGTLPTSMGGLTELTDLELGHNRLSGPIPAELGNLTNLTNLYLYGNQLNGEIPATLGNLKKLTDLSLGDNQLTGAIPVELGNLTDLTSLFLNINQLTGNIPAELGKLKHLINLSLYTNQLGGEIPVALGDLVSLETLLLDRNQLSGPIPAELGNPTNLVSLSLESNQLSGSIPMELGNLRNLQYLSLAHNQLAGNIPVELCNLTNLTALYLQFNRLSCPIPAELGHLTRLVYLVLSNNQLDGPIPPELGDLTNLLDLSLSDNELTGEVPVSLDKLTKLETLNLRMNNLTGVPESLAQLPNWDGFNADVTVFPQKQGIIGFIRPEGAYRVNLAFAGDAREVNQAAGGHLYGVQVLSRAAGTADEYLPYGYGLYDDSTKVQLELPGDREYTIYATLVADGQAKVQPSGNWYAQPFVVGGYAPVTRGVTPLPDYEEGLPSGVPEVNVFMTDSRNALNGIHRGTTVLAADGKEYDRPNTARYFGERLNYTPTGNETLTVDMARALFAVTCEVDDLQEGHIRVEIEGAPAMYIDAQAETHSVSSVFTFANPDGGWTDANYSETLNVKFIWEKTNGLERELSSEQVVFTRATATRLHTVFKDDGMSMDIENKPLKDGEVIDIEGIIW